jgi:hypothetical protein
MSLIILLLLLKSHDISLRIISLPLSLLGGGRVIILFIPALVMLLLCFEYSEHSMVKWYSSSIELGQNGHRLKSSGIYLPDSIWSLCALMRNLVKSLLFRVMLKQCSFREQHFS